MRFEYTIHKSVPSLYYWELNQFGFAGWELVSVAVFGDSAYFYFKRAVQE